MKLSANDARKFWSKVDVRGKDDCWEWKAGKVSAGYGSVWLGGKTLLAHRVAWQISNGRQPREGYDIAHAPIVCHNRLCCNPSHLSEKSKQENKADQEIDGTVPRGEKNGNSTHPESRGNGERNGRAKLTQSEVDEIRALRAQGITLRVLSSRFKIGMTQTWEIANGISWKK